ncbi:Imm1 family immunity protein [Burkholderia diffusa]|uniref:Imm1 family immunity protein n=1 Tax=Burkholderia diffusa TaxID=488732 RepID=UPI00157A3A44|nr:Imm1 family immunity protein [Burkholderia diffusa]NTY41639.1 hypothetical protein [Burkholderia diffusa]
MKPTKIEDFAGVCEVRTRTELDAVLAKRYLHHTVNEFWLYHGEGRYPALTFMINCQLATAHYFPETGHPGFASAGNVENLDPGGHTKFYMAENQTIVVSNRLVIPSEIALHAAHDFAESSRRPNCIGWIEL